MNNTSQIVTFQAYVIPGTGITSATIFIYRIGEESGEQISTGTTTTPGFQLQLSLDTASRYYIRMQVTEWSQDGKTFTTDGRSITLLAAFNSEATTVSISAQSTIAAAFTFARFTSLDSQGNPSIAGATRAINIAYAMKNNFVRDSGTISPVISKSPNGLETNSYPLFNFLSNLCYYCLTDADVYKEFISLSGAMQCYYEALYCIITKPFTNVGAIYNLISNMPQVLTPSLPGLSLPGSMTPVPNQWTLTIKANDSGARNFLIAGAAFAVFDKEDKAWIANNCRAGSPNSGTHCIVLNADGSPASISPICGGGILGPGFGIAIDDKGETIAIGNFGWGEELWNPQEGSVSIFKYDGTIVSPPNGFTNGLSRVQGLCYDRKGNLWMASVGSQQPMPPLTPPSIYNFTPQDSAIVVYLDGDPNRMVKFDNFQDDPNPYHNTFDVAIDSNGYAYVSNIGKANIDKKGINVKSSVYKMELINGTLQVKASWVSDWINPNDGVEGCEELRQVTIGPNGNIFVVAITSSRVIELDNDLKYKGEYTQNIHAPWGITFDKNGTMFVANFGHDTERKTSYNTYDMEGPFGVTVIQNLDKNSAIIMTVPTGGDEVMLRNGCPLYGTQNTPTAPGNDIDDVGRIKCYEPIMRLTSTSIDRAGNLWAMNNWKPSKYVDIKDNPGADGVVIYIGVASPIV